MELKSLNCPNCGGSVNIPEGVSRFYCTYCGSQIQVDDGKITIDLNANINLDHRYTDVARLKELELQEKEQKQKEEEKLQEKKKKKEWVLTLLIAIIVYALNVAIGLKFDNKIGKIAKTIAIIVAIVVPIALIIMFPKDWRKKSNRQEKTGCATSIVKAFVALMIFMLYWVLFIMPLYM